MTAVNTNDSPHQLLKTQLWIPRLSLSETRTLLNDCLFFSVNNFFIRDGFLFYFIFSAHGYGFSVRVPKQRLLRRCPEAGMGEESKTAFQKARTGGLVFAVRTRSRRFREGEKTGKGWGQYDVGSLPFFYSVHSTAHGKPLVVDSSSYV